MRGWEGSLSRDGSRIGLEGGSSSLRDEEELADASGPTCSDRGIPWNEDSSSEMNSASQAVTTFFRAFENLSLISSTWIIS